MDKIINGVVYRDKNELYLISFFTEKKYQIFDNLYFKFFEDKPLDESYLVLVHYTEKNKNTFTTIPIVDFNVTFKKKSVKVSRLDVDTIINNAYKAATVFLKSKQDLNEDIV